MLPEYGGIHPYFFEKLLMMKQGDKNMMYEVDLDKMSSIKKKII